MTVGSDKYAHLRERLEQEKARLTGEVQDLGNREQERGREAAEEVRAYSNHPGDESSDLFDQERDMTLQRNLESLLEEVDVALHRMDEGTYGTCVDCGKEIPIERLESKPSAIRCVEDQQKEDRRNSL